LSILVKAGVEAWPHRRRDDGEEQYAQPIKAANPTAWKCMRLAAFFRTFESREHGDVCPQHG
jgi:hypothetical protein